jgi:hypothetical protein
VGRLDRIRFRRDTAANWTSVNPVLGDGEPGFERDTDQFKIGDGVTAWNDLDYITGGAAASGLDGLDGLDGNDGATGATGATGPTGPAGADGAAGAPGAAGADGTPGLDGLDGNDGDTGATGATGAQGPQGDPGATGPTGADGIPGIDGIDGNDGAAGAAGSNGADGAPGAAGAAGLDGFDGNDSSPASASALGIYGDGSEGTVQFVQDGTTTAGATKSGSGATTTYLMTRDIYAQDLIVDSGVTLKPDGYRIFVRSTLTNNGTIKMDGGAGSTATTNTGATGGAAPHSGNGVGSYAKTQSATTIAEGGAGGNAGSNGTGGANFTNVLHAGQYRSRAGGGAGGAGGGASATPPTGGATGGATATSGLGGLLSLYDLVFPIDWGAAISSNPAALLGFGTGAGGGGGSASAKPAAHGGGGGGGGAGGCFFVAARYIINNGTISAKGGAGGGGDADGGGGGGGGGGVIALTYDTYTGTAAVVTGGAAGAAGPGTWGGASLNPSSTINSTADLSTYTSASITPSSGTTYVLGVTSEVASGTANAPTVSGTNGWNVTWTQISTVTYNGGLNRITLFSGVASSSVAGTLSFAFGGQTQIGCAAIRTSGLAGFGGTTTFVTNSGASGNASVSLGTVPQGATVIAFAADRATAANFAAGTGFTEQLEIANGAGGAGALQLQDLDAATAAPTTCAWTNTSGAWGCIAAILQATTYTAPSAGAAGANGTVYTIQNT